MFSTFKNRRLYLPHENIGIGTVTMKLEGLSQSLLTLCDVLHNFFKQNHQFYFLILETQVYKLTHSHCNIPHVKDITHSFILYIQKFLSVQKKILH